MDLSQKLDAKDLENTELKQRVEFLEKLLKTRPRLNYEYKRQEFVENSNLANTFDYEAKPDYKLDEAFRTVDDHVLPRVPSENS